MGRPLIVEQAGERPRHFAVLVTQLVGPFRPLSSAAKRPSGVPEGAEEQFELQGTAEERGIA